ncbi:MAG: lipoyl(octanoyl) transferase LipB [Deltaproteobacteria bacterium]|nr:lipoyl(octanoyl) transferase LipB [Deltaproteobacteria bacterium]
MKLIDLGRKSYAEVWELQKQLVDERARDAIEDTLIFVEHEPVYTTGRAKIEEPAPEAIKVRGLGTVPVVAVERGGRLTFHGPGQLVGYPIFKLTHKDLRRYLRDLERALLETLRVETGLGVKPCPDTLLLDPGQLQTGVWVHDHKLASIGIAVKQWVSYHGFALNLATDLRYFEAVNPCGFNGAVMTTLEKEMARAGAADSDVNELAGEIKQALVKKFETLSRSYEAFALQSAASVFGAAETGAAFKEA